VRLSKSNQIQALYYKTCTVASVIKNGILTQIVSNYLQLQADVDQFERKLLDWKLRKGIVQEAHTHRDSLILI
jgi:hypothetical protein